MEILIQVVLLAVGFGLLVKGADWFVEGAAGIADKFGIPQLIIGLTIVAFGTSAPEAAVSITAGLKGNAGISIGNVVGSNILNVLVILGITAVIVPVAVQMSTLKAEIPFMIGITILLMILGYFGESINFLDGMILWAVFILFFVYLFRMMKKGGGQTEETPQIEKKTYQLVLITLCGLGVIILGSDIAVDSATRLAEIFGISQRIIGLTIVALGTSLPELVTSVLAAMKGKADIAIGNIVGSNIFNILFVLGTTSLITTIPFASNFLVDTMVAVAAGILLLLCVVKSKKLTRSGGIIMLIGYAGYFVYLIK